MNTRRFPLALPALAILVGLAPAQASGQQEAYPAPRWYLELAAGSELRSGMHHTGKSCLPGAACQNHLEYRQDYASHGGSGLNFSASAGYRHNKLRFEITALQHAGTMNHGFSSLANVDANGIRDHSVYSVATNGRLRTHTVALGFYRDVTAGAATSYLGAGIGLTQTAADGIYYEPGNSFESALSCTGSRCSVSHHDSHAFDVRGWGISRHLYGGVDYDFGAPFLLGAKLAYSFFADLQGAGRDDLAPGMRSAAMSVGGINRLSFSVGIKYGLGK